MNWLPAQILVSKIYLFYKYVLLQSTQNKMMITWFKTSREKKHKERHGDDIGWWDKAAAMQFIFVVIALVQQN